MDGQSTTTRHISTCPVCENAQWRKMYSMGEWTVGQCTRCKFARIDPLPSRATRPEMYSKERVTERNVKQKPFFSRLARTMKRFFNTLFRHNKNDLFLKKLKKYVTPGGKVLDLGCGSGGILLAARETFECHGIEISSYLAEHANKHAGLNVRVGDIQAIDYGDEKFDAITQVSIIEHLDDPWGMVKRCYELLKPGGVLILKTVNYECWNRHIGQSRWTGLRPPDHVVYFTPGNLKKMLKRAGFSKTKSWALPLSDNMYVDAWK